MRFDVLALQEAVVDDRYDQAVDLLGGDYQVAHQRVGLIGDGRHHGASVASRWPIGQAHEVDLHLTARTGDYSCGTVIAEVLAPEPLGRLLVVSHGSSWAWWAEHERELQGTSTAYRDCWESVHGNDPGLTFDPRNPLTHHDEPDRNRGRRIDYLLVRCHDHGPSLRIADCRLVFDQPVDGVMASDHYGVVADLEAGDDGG